MGNTDEKKEMPLDFVVVEVYPNGNSLVITLPANHVKYSGLVAGDLLKIYYKKVGNKNDSNNSK